MRRLRLLATALIVAAAACTVPQGGSGATAAPAAARLAETDVTITTDDGKRHIYRVEIARSPEEHAKGLMFRRKMARNRGMIFPMNPPRYASFWMENTYLPLDIIFIASDRRVLNIVEGKPLSRDILNSIAPAAAVLELNAGESARIGLEPGDMIDGKF